MVEIAIITIGIVILLLLGWSIWKDVRRTRRWKEAVRIAASNLPRAEQIEWFNRIGRYKEPGAIPRNLALEHMTPDELGRLIGKTGEFSD